MAMPGSRRDKAAWRNANCEKRRCTVMCVEGGENMVVTEYIVYAPVIFDSRLEGEWTITEKLGTFARQEGGVCTFTSPFLGST